MKLYTEEDVRKAMRLYLETTKTDKEIFEQLTPIELLEYKEQLNRIERLLLSQIDEKSNRFNIGPL